MRWQANAALGSALLMTGLGALRDAGEASPDIIQGRPVSDGELDDVVGVLLEAPGGAHLLVCSGVAIAPRYVLTAAHCARSGVRGVYVGNPAEDRMDLAPTVRVKAAYKHPAYRRYQPGSDEEQALGRFDLAVLELEQPLDLETYARPPATTRAWLDALQPNRPVTIAGFGMRDAEGDGWDQVGRKFEAKTFVRALNRGEIYAGGPEGDACLIDSGGPMFASLASSEGDERALIGVSSRGPVPCARASSPGKWTSMRSERCWIAEVTGLSAWAQGYPCEASRGLVRDSAPDFVSSCERPVSPEIAYTYWVLGAEAARLSGEEGALGCEETYRVLSPLTRLSIHAMGVIDASPLRFLPRLEAIDLAYNRIVRFDEAWAGPALSTLDVRGNAIREACPLDRLAARGVSVTGGEMQEPLEIE